MQFPGHLSSGLEQALGETLICATEVGSARSSAHLVHQPHSLVGACWKAQQAWPLCSKNASALVLPASAYCDEVFPETRLKHSNTRKLQIIHWSFRELGQRALACENCWFVLTVLRSQRCDPTRGMLSWAHLLPLLFATPSLRALRAIQGGTLHSRSSTVAYSTSCKLGGTFKISQGCTTTTAQKSAAHPGA